MNPVFHLSLRCLLSAALLAGLPISAQVLINEVHYDPDIKTEPVEFIELHNAGSSPVDLGGWQLVDAVALTLPAGTVLPARGYLVLAGNPAAVQAKFGVSALGPWVGSLANEGETIELRDAAGARVDAVSYQLGFPWPTVGEPPGYSIELIHPGLDNDLGGSWRASVAGDPGQTSQQLIPTGATWQYLKGLTDPSTPVSAWRAPDFDASGWASGPAPVGYDAALAFGTPLPDMRGSYPSFFVRRTFVVDDVSLVTALTAEVLYDDAFKLWINGTNVLNVSLPASEVPYSATAGGSARESNDYEPFSLLNVQSYLRAGTNVIAAQVHNISLSDSSDCFFDLRLLAEEGPLGRGPTPGALNAVSATNAPPQVRQVDHAPHQPAPSVPVTVTARVTDPEGVASVTLQYQAVDPGSYIELTDAAYATSWVAAPMADDGSAGDARALDGEFTAVLPAALQTHRRLVRYRIQAVDRTGRSVTVPYADDPQPNFAYFVYAGVPAWTGAVRPGDAGALGQVFTVSSNAMNRLPVIHLLAKQATVEESTWLSRYGGDAYPWLGTLVYDGDVYDHIHHRARGGVWRYAMCKNMWKFDLNRGHDFRMRDNWGRAYATRWTKLNLGASIQQGDYNHRGEQGLFESIGFRMFELAGVPAPRSTYIQFRIIDAAAETGATQWDGDFWGVYLALEQENGRFLEEHGLPDANFYKMEGGTGELNNLGPEGPTDKSDLNDFLAVVNSGAAATETWWRTNLNLPRYYSYQTVVQSIHHYDICYDKNFFYYRHPETGRWEVLPWDLDLTWAENMFDAGCGGVDRIKSRILPNATAWPMFHLEWRNRIREWRDLHFNADEAGRLIDEFAGRLRGPTDAPGLLDADRAQWDYNPRMIDGTYTSSPGSKAGHGRFYRWPNEPTVTRDFAGAVQLMKNYVGFRSTNAGARAQALDLIAADPSIPATPTLTYTGPTNFPANRIALRTSAFSGTGSFGSLRWRVGEVHRPTGPSWQSAEPWPYEIEAVWESGELAPFVADAVVPPGLLKVGHTYRARVRMTDAAGRTSHWSAPVEFVVTEPDTALDLLNHLRLTELMFAPPGGSDDEFVELHNTSTNRSLELGGARFSSGIDFTFPAGTSLAPGAYVLVVRADPTGGFATFRARYALSAGTVIVGPYTGSLANEGEPLVLKTTAAGAAIVSFEYGTSHLWPVAAEGTGHSMVPLDRALRGQASGALDDPGNWRISAQLRGSPGRADPGPAPPGLRLNEVVAHTDYSNPQRPEYDSNDWIELVNVGAAPVSFAGCYLSDDPANLRKWALPAGSLAAGDRIVFDEIDGFHDPITTGFGLDKAGEQVLLAYLPGTTADRVVDAVRFRGQENERSLGRYPDGGTYWYGLGRTRMAVNSSPAEGVIVSEVHYQPPETVVGVDNVAEEFVELFNPTAGAVPLQDTNGVWRLDGGIRFVFPVGVTLPAQGRLLVVNFDPADPVQLAAFKARYGLTNNPPPILGPYGGKLSNRSDRVALERPQFPDLPGDPYSWVVLDEVSCGNQDPWPESAAGLGHSLQRRDPLVTGHDPANWFAAAPSPATGGSPTGDRDGDGMSDAWESLYTLDPDDPTDAGEDADADGLTNLEEFRAGTNPRDAASGLWLEAYPAAGTGVELRFLAVPGLTYHLEFCADLGTGGWTVLQVIPPLTGAEPQTVSITDAGTPGQPERFYRVVKP